MGEIIFFHKKHVEWNGCGVRNAEVFKGGNWDVQQNTRDEIGQKHFCCVYHATVAFPIDGGGWCYAKAVQ